MVIFSADKFEVLNADNQLVIREVEEGGLYRGATQGKNYLANGIELWHRRLCHFNGESLRQLKTSEGVEFSNEGLANCTDVPGT